MATAEGGQGIAFCDGHMHLVVPDEMRFFEDLEGI
jgi:hypothetical protein